jgi:putative flippase GtrA
MKTSTTKKRPLTFFFVGTSLTLLDFAAYSLLSILVFNSPDQLKFAAMISGIVATVAAYFAHQFITWKDKQVSVVTVIKFLAANVLSALIIRPILLTIFIKFTALYQFAFWLTTLLGLPFSYEFVEGTVVFGLMTLVVMFVNYTLYSKFVFNKPAPEKPSKTQ